MWHTPNISKLPILEQQEFLPLRDLLQASDRAVGKIADDVRVCLQHADVLAYFFGEAQELVGGFDVGGDAEVGALDGNEMQEVGG